MDAGFDLVAAEDVIIEPGWAELVPTGLAFEIPEGYEMHIRPRSGITLKTKLRVQLGTVNAGYRGEVGVIVDNIDRDTDIEKDFLIDVSEKIVSALDYLGAWDHFARGSYIVRKGDRIAQGVIKPVEQAVFTEVDMLGDSDRGAGCSGIN
ncbi:deoxyuridine 5'-triphosphate nucleotidohydrolase [Bacillus inaquosorum]|nr:deoxyuridine 5'-triphosphate nucleotidohydrolase [Bacillus inaquosorum]MCY9039682.1 deoxyuridine 5'-triphosphate nucleotidohydrolase [Bacillus inaquosorum]MCY9045136.1 deoxyuridine 5'-triphosphate nucleotidohydrolase [Bacillus inaquosorum]